MIHSIFFHLQMGELSCIHLINQKNGISHQVKLKDLRYKNERTGFRGSKLSFKTPKMEEFNTEIQNKIRQHITVNWSET